MSIMKITPEHYERLRAVMLAAIAKHPESAAAYRAAGHSDARYAWDVFHYTKFDSRELYKYLNDSHIQTALLRIIREKE